MSDTPEGNSQTPASLTDPQNDADRVRLVSPEICTITISEMRP